MIEQLGLDGELLKKMYEQIRQLIDDPVKMDAFYLEMRLVNDPDMGRHAEDFNLMVNQMIDQTKTKLSDVSQLTNGQGFAGLSGLGSAKVEYPSRFAG